MSQPSKSPVPSAAPTPPSPAELRAVWLAARRVALFTTDLRGIIQSFNPGAELLTGHQAARLRGRDAWGLLFAPPERPDSPGLAAPAWRRRVEGKSHWEGDLSLIRADGSTLPVCLRLTGLPVKDGEAPGFLWLATDISERKQAEAHLAEISERLEMMVIERTEDLRALNQSLEEEVAARRQAEKTLRQSEERLNRAQHLAHLGSWELDLARGTLAVSRELRRLLGLKEDGPSLAVRRIWRLVPAVERHTLRQTLADLLARGGLCSLEHRLRRLDGVERLMLSTVELERGADGHPLRLMGSLQDVTQRRRSEDQNRLLARVFENTGEGIVVTDHDGKIRMVNSAFTAITGFLPSEAVGNRPHILSSGRQEPEFYQALWESLAKTGHWRGEIWNRRKDGEVYPQWLAITAISDLAGRVTHYVGVFHDISELKANQERIAHQAYHDALTGLPNRLLFNDRLTMALAHAQRNRQGLTVMFLDLDNFKHINDSLGHAVGDRLLTIVARRLSQALRQEDTVARLGGDEFILLLPGVDDPESASAVGKRILELVAEPCQMEGHELYITASIGITLYPHDGARLEALVANADLAMYRAKEWGKNCCRLFTPAMNLKVQQRMEMESALRRALRQDELLLHYQPKVELDSGRVVGVEALLRWRHPSLGVVSPEEFVPLAEETGLIVPIGEWVLRTACAQARAWHLAGFAGLQMAVNLSPRQFAQRNLVTVVRAALAESGLPPSCLELEVTEGVVMQSVEEAIATLGELSALGVRLALDDFGRGYSSLYYLKRFPMNALKIDRSFVADIATDHDDASIVNTIISMSQSLKLKVVAEGVETAAQLDFLRARHCDQMQGYLFSQPLPAQDLEHVLARHFGPPPAGIS